ncbi:MAG: ATP-grasp domain-containing protein [Patescibacteria group bacterium]
MKILIIGPNTYANRRLVAAAKARRHQVTLASIINFYFVLKDKKFTVRLGKKDIREFDVTLIRGVYPHMEKTRTIAKYLKRCKKEVVDRELYRKVYVVDKMFSYAALSFHGLPCADSWLFSSLSEFKKSGVKLPFPVLVKDLRGMHGRNIFKKDNKTQLLKLLTERDINDFFIQKIIKSNHYYRIFVIDGRIVASIKRYSLDYLSHHQVPLSGRSAKHVLTSKQKALALKAVKASNADIAGVDLMYDQDGHPYILEVNRCPGFRALTRATGIDIAARVIKFLEKLKSK